MTVHSVERTEPEAVLIQIRQERLHNPQPVRGGLVQHNGQFAVVVLAVNVPPSTVISIQRGDMLLIGEAIASRSSVDGFEVRVRIEQILSGLQSLLRLREQLTSENTESRMSRSAPELVLAS